MSDEKMLLIELVRNHIESDRKVQQDYVKLLENISERTIETQRCVNKFDKKLDLSIQKIEYEIREINKLDQQQNEQLAEHIKGVNTNTERLELQKKEFDNRLKILESPNIWKKETFKRLTKSVGFITAVSAMIFGLIKIIPYVINIFDK